MNPGHILAKIDRFAMARIVSELAGGPTSDSYLVERDPERFVLRIDTGVAAALGLDRCAEAEILAYVHRNGLGPGPEFAAPEQGILITRYVEGRSWDETDLHDAQRIRRLAALLRRLHALEPVGPPFNLQERILGYERTIGTPEGYELAQEAQRRLRELETGTATSCLCHNDLVSMNIIESQGPAEGEGLRLIDWEYAAVGDPFFDLATIAEHHRFDRDEAGELLCTYFGKIREEDSRRLAGYRKLYENLSRLWHASVENIRERNAG